MNMSLKDIFLWLVALDFPSISAIWNWLITVPWWLAIFTVCLGWFLARALFNLASNTYNWLSSHSYSFGQRVRHWYLVAMQVFR